METKKTVSLGTEFHCSVNSYTDNPEKTME